jgi:hypothetical protein
VIDLDQYSACTFSGLLLHQNNISWDSLFAGRLCVLQQGMWPYLPSAGQQAWRQHPTQYIAREDNEQDIERLSCSTACWAQLCTTPAATTAAAAAVAGLLLLLLPLIL